MFRTPFFSGSADNYNAARLMSTNVQEHEDGYALDIELPGFNKEDIKAELKDGYLTVTATRSENKEEKDGEGKFIRKERFEGTCKRSFFVGETITEEDIKAQYENGILKLEIPKEKEQLPEQPKLIQIA